MAFFVCRPFAPVRLSKIIIVRNHAKTRFFHAAALLLITLFFVAPENAPAATGDDARLQSIIETLRGKNAAVGKANLTNIAAIIAFYERGAMTLAWSRPGAIDELRSAIRAAEGDGLRPADYHLAALDAAAASQDAVTTDLIASDAVIRLIAHLRYGKVNPAQLNRSWNHPARLDDQTLDTLLDQARAAPSLDQALDLQRPKHFVYEGLRHALERYRTLAAAGGWPNVERSARVKPGADDPSIPSIRLRLRVTGEWSGGDAALASTTYDDALVAAIKIFKISIACVTMALSARPRWMP